MNGDNRRMMISLIALLSLNSLQATQEFLDKPNDAPRLGQRIISTPGLSGSFDYSNFESVREPFTKNLITLLNKISLPNFDIPGGLGYFKQNKLTLYQNTEPIIFEPVESMNALMFKLTNIKGNIRINDFYIELAGFLPIKGYLDITMSSIQLGFKA